jgi:hypothetical protein
MFLSRRVHTRAGRKVVRGLGAAVQHDDQGHRLAVIAAGHVEFVGPAAGLITVCAGWEFCAVRQIGGARRRRPVGQAAGQVEPAVGCLVDKATQRIGPHRLNQLVFDAKCRVFDAVAKRLVARRRELELAHFRAMPSMVGGPCRVCKATLFTGSPAPSMRCSAAVASLSCPALVRRVASSSSAGREKFMVMAFCVGP